MWRKCYWIVGVVLFCLCGLFSEIAQASQFKVLVVFSYEETFIRNQEIREAIDAVLSENCEIRYFYMNTKENPADGNQKAKDAYNLYHQFEPDGIIAADDDAQSMFVVPYLKDKVRTPVIFCGVNADPKEYGYPASNVSGILQHLNVKESISFLQMLVPSVKTIGYIMRESSTGKAIIKQIQKESDTYSAKSVAFKLPKTMKEVKTMTEELKETCDALFVGTLRGILDDDGKPLTNKDVMPVIVKTFGKPVISSNPYRVKYGALCAVAQTGQEQGETAAKMLLKAMNGTPLSQIPITQNIKCKPIINSTVLETLGIRPDPSILFSAKFVKTEE